MRRTSKTARASKLGATSHERKRENHGRNKSETISNLGRVPRQPSHKPLSTPCKSKNKEVPLDLWKLESGTPTDPPVTRLPTTPLEPKLEPLTWAKGEIITPDGRPNPYALEEADYKTVLARGRVHPLHYWGSPSSTQKTVSVSQSAVRAATLETFLADRSLVSPIVSHAPISFSSVAKCLPNLRRHRCFNWPPTHALAKRDFIAVPGTTCDTSTASGQRPWDSTPRWRTLSCRWLVEHAIHTPPKIPPLPRHEVA